MRAVDAGDGDLRVAVPALDHYGDVHRGILFTLADDAMGVTPRRLVWEDARTVT